MLYDNPASSLHRILSLGVREKHEQACHEVWRRLLEVKPDDIGGLVSKLARVMELPRQTLIVIQTCFPNQIDASRVWMAPIESAFMQQQLAGQWGSFAGQIQPYCIAQLSLTAELLQTRITTQLLEETELNRLLAELSTLVQEIDSSKLSPSLKAYLARELTEIQQAIRDYKVNGALPVLRNVEAMLGHSLLDPSYSSFLKDHELGARLLDNLSAMANLLTVAVSLPQLSQGLAALMLR